MGCCAAEIRSASCAVAWSFPGICERSGLGLQIYEFRFRNIKIVLNCACDWPRLLPQFPRLIETEPVSFKGRGLKFPTVLECHVLNHRNGLTPDDQRSPMRVRILDPRPDAWRGEGTSPHFHFHPPLDQRFAPSKPSFLKVRPNHRCSAGVSPLWRGHPFAPLRAGSARALLRLVRGCAGSLFKAG